MAEKERTPDKPGAAGKEPTVVEGMNVEDVQLIPNKNGTVSLRVTAGAEEIEVTVVTPGETGGLKLEDRVVKVPKEKTKIIGPLDPKVYNNSKGFVEVKFNKVTGVKMEITDVSF